MSVLEAAVTVASTLLGSGGILFYIVKSYVDKQAVVNKAEIKEHISKEINSTAFAYDIVRMDIKKKQIERFLEALCLRFNAQSAWLGLFHNGELMSNNDHRIKVTCAYEWPPEGLVSSKGEKLSVKDIVSGVFVLQMGQWIGRLLKDDWYCNSKDTIEDAVMARQFEIWELHENVNALIYLNGKPVGVIGMNWTEKNQRSFIEKMGASDHKEAIRKFRSQQDGLVQTLMTK